MSDNAFGPNEERYKKASEPHADKEAASHALQIFFQEVSALREDYKIPEVLIVAAAYYGDPEPDKRETHAAAAGFGNPAMHPDLAAAAHRIYVSPIIKRAEELESAAAPGRRRKSR